MYLTRSAHRPPAHHCRRTSPLAVLLATYYASPPPPAGCSSRLSAAILLFVSYFCSYSSDRIRELARPKKPKAAWENYSSRLEWGNQETIWPFSLSALTARPTPRIMFLAKPKKIFNSDLQRRLCLFLYSCGRMSEIWQRPPLMDLALPSPRILKLAEPKKYQTAYLKQRPRSSPEWPMPTAALTYEASQRVLELARPKSVHPGFVLDRKVERQITDTARMTLTPPRTQRLAQPKIQKNTLCSNRGSPESMIRPVSRSAQQAVASVRTLELAKAKVVSPEYLPARDTERPVTKAAKHAVTTPRIEELSQPCKRPTANLAQFDPDAFLVKESAKKAVCSSRLQKLARPIER
ncbi:testicular haploid expressed gene protein-like [Terrapene carolina triunguis]|uniref:testicular haploid expressed gene protein-like n=1 Tax=Terrapene triunguis TaxID=2587831 RepID=UPI000E777F54|nr:testicular haploid expressed gene protein-like [Terrapene carolina triunguis]